MGRPALTKDANVMQQAFNIVADACKKTLMCLDDHTQTQKSLELIRQALIEHTECGKDDTKKEEPK